MLCWTLCSGSAARGVARPGAEEMAVRPEREQQSEAVHHEQHDAGAQRDTPFVLLEMDVVHPLGAEMEDRGAEHGRDGDGEQPRVRLRGAQAEGLLLAPPATDHHGAAGDQQEIAEDGSGDGRLHHRVQTLRERDDGEDQLRRVPEGGVQQAAPRGPEADGEAFRRRSHQQGQRNHPDRRQGEGRDRLPWRAMRQPMADEREHDGRVPEEVRDPHRQATCPSDGGGSTRAATVGRARRASAAAWGTPSRACRRRARCCPRRSARRCGRARRSAGRAAARRASSNSTSCASRRRRCRRALTPIRRTARRGRCRSRAPARRR